MLGNRLSHYAAQYKYCIKLHKPNFQTKKVAHVSESLRLFLMQADSEPFLLCVQVCLGEVGSVDEFLVVLLDVCSIIQWTLLKMIDL